MGLDLWHAKFSHKQKETDEYLTLEEIIDFPLIGQRHWDLITHVVVSDMDFTIYILSDEEGKLSYKRFLDNDSEKCRILIRSTDDVEAEILRIESECHLTGMHKFIHEIGTGNNELRIEYAKSYEMVPVIYWTGIGYQRKGMRYEFYEAFENCKAYFRKEDVLRAATFLIEKGTFQEDFIDNFVEGDSVFMASW